MLKERISAGSYDLNKWLYGGYEKGIITTIFGPAGSGKTNFCELAAVSQAKKGNKVIFIDTEGGFSVERIRQIAGKEHDRVLQRILLLRALNFEEQKKAIDSLLKEMKSDAASLIIIDGMTMLYRLETAEKKEKIQEVNSELARQMRVLAELAQSHSLAVLITNQVYSEFLPENDYRAGKKADTRMVGGDILRYWSKCIIELKNEKGKRKAFLLKHRSLPEKNLDFYITNEGIRKRGWI